MKKLLLSAFILPLLFSCTENQRARSFGGTSVIELPKNTIVLNASWKKEDLWVILKDTITNEVYVRESSSFGLMEGEVKFKSEK